MATTSSSLVKSKRRKSQSVNSKSTKSNNNRSSVVLGGKRKKRQYNNRLDLSRGGGGNLGDDELIESDDASSVDGGSYGSNDNEKERIDEDDDSEEENLDVKKVRLARQYLDKLDERTGLDDSSSDSESNNDNNDHWDDKNDNDNSEGGVGGTSDIVSRRLQRERLKQQGMLERPAADKVERYVASLNLSVAEFHKRPAIALLPSAQATKTWVEAGAISLLKGHDMPPTCVALQYQHKKHGVRSVISATGTAGSNNDSPGSVRAVSGSKDHSVLLWDIEREMKLETIVPHWRERQDSTTQQSFRTNGQVLCVACSDDGRFAAVGRRDATVSIFDLRIKKKPNNSIIPCVKTFRGHRDAVTCLTFRTQSSQLFSGSADRCVKHYDLEEMMEMETLYGHQFGVLSIDCHRKERPVSVASDRTARAWKLQEDTHLIFRGGGKLHPADCVTLLHDDWFATGHQEGTLSLWKMDKKKAVVSIENAHGLDHQNHQDNTTKHGPPIVSIDSLKGSDLVATGSHDGYLRFWKVDTAKEAGRQRGQLLADKTSPSASIIQPLTQIPLHGFVNDIAIGQKGRFCVAAVGQEHRLGRWTRIPGAKNRIAVIQLKSNEYSDHDDNDDESDGESDANHMSRNSLQPPHSDDDSEEDENSDDDTEETR